MLEVPVRYFPAVPMAKVTALLEVPVRYALVNGPDCLIFVVYFLVVIGVGIWVKRPFSSKASYRKMRLQLLVPSALLIFVLVSSFFVSAVKAACLKDQWMSDDGRCHECSSKENQYQVVLSPCEARRDAVIVWSMNRLPNAGARTQHPDRQVTQAAEPPISEEHGGSITAATASPTYDPSTPYVGAFPVATISGYAIVFVVVFVPAVLLVVVIVVSYLKHRSRRSRSSSGDVERQSNLSQGAEPRSQLDIPLMKISDGNSGVAEDQ